MGSQSIFATLPPFLPISSSVARKHLPHNQKQLCYSRKVFLSRSLQHVYSSLTLLFNLLIYSEWLWTKMDDSRWQHMSVDTLEKVLEACTLTNTKWIRWLLHHTLCSHCYNCQNHKVWPLKSNKFWIHPNSLWNKFWTEIGTILPYDGVWELNVEYQRVILGQMIHFY